MGARRWWLIGRARRLLLLARYWQADGDLDEAARHCRHAWRLARRCPAAPVSVVAEIGLTMARIDRDPPR